MIVIKFFVVEQLSTRGEFVVFFLPTVFVLVIFRDENINFIGRYIPLSVGWH